VKTVFELKGVSLYYGEVPILVNINAKFFEKRITCLVGDSGVGKSTFLRTLNRMNDLIPSFRCRGSVIFKGRDIYSHALDVNILRQKVGMVFQEPCVFPVSIYDNVLFGLRRLIRRRKSAYPMIVEETLKAVFLWEEVKDRLYGPAIELSQGQQQRLTIARALAVYPQVLLLDEPTSSLDNKSSMAIEELLKGLKEKLTIILATHKLKQVERLADDVISIP
jgi:phosphate transport system ATP-binding protein